MPLKNSLTTLLLIVITMIISCSDDKSKTCTTCNTPQTILFELCQEPNGNASVNGEDTGVGYAIYLAELEADGAVCGSN